MLSVLAILASGSMVSANTFTADGTVFEPSHTYSWQADRLGLIEDGSFEDGTCYTGDSSWTCESDNDCDWIADLVPLGLWNYDGMHVAWLGGFCGGEATEHTSICQEIYIDGPTLSWWGLRYDYTAVPLFEA